MYIEEMEAIAVRDLSMGMHDYHNKIFKSKFSHKI